MSSLKWKSLNSGSKAKAKDTIANKSLCKIDYSVTLALIRNMDCDNGWAELASKFGYIAEQIFQLKEMRYKPNGSPTDTLLWELGCQGYKVRDLYEKLKLIRRFREVEILEEYVRKYKESPLGDSGACAFPDHRAELPEEDKSLHAEFQDLDTLLRQVKIPAADEAFSDNSVQAAESAVNYNYSLHKAQSRKDVKPNTKSNYEKIIPWTDNSPEILDPAKSTLGCASSKSSNSSISLTQKHKASDSDDPPSSTAAQLSVFDSCLPDSSSSPSMCSGVDNLLNMIGRPQTPLKGSVSVGGSSVNYPDMESVSLKPLFSFKEICEATGNFSEDKVLGLGAFGTVYRGNLRSIDCAIKLLNPSEEGQDTDMKQFLSELNMLKEFSHENIVVLYGYALGHNQLCLVYQHLINGSLEDRLLLKKGTPALTWQRRLNILVGACRGLNVLHTFREKPLIHGDIKSANILLDQNWEAKIADLGQSAYATGVSKDTKGFTHVSVVQTKTKVFGSKAYHAPEVLRSNQLSTKSDVYAMGVVFLEVCSGQKAYDPNRGVDSILVRTFTDLEEDQWVSFQDKNLNVIPHSSFTSILEIANSCVLESKKKRPTTKLVLERVERCFNQYVELSFKENVNSSHACSPQVESQPIDERQRKLDNILTDSTHASINSSVPGSLETAEQEPVLQPHGIPTANQPLEESQCTTQQSINSFLSQSHEVFSSLSSKSSIFQSSPMQDMPQFSAHQYPRSQEEGKSLPDAYNLPQPSSMTSENTNISLEVMYGDSLAIRLQKAVDQSAAKKELLRQEGVEDPESLSRQLLSQEIEDIKKQWLAENQSRWQNENSKPTDLPVEDDYFPKADPKKLLELYVFDKQNVSDSISSQQNNPGPAVFQSDPKKLAYMQHFDAESGKPFVTSTAVESEQKHSLQLTNNLPQSIMSKAGLSQQSHISTLPYAIPNSAMHVYSPHSQSPFAIPNHPIPQQSMNWQANNPGYVLETDGINYTYSNQNGGIVYGQGQSGMGDNTRSQVASSTYSFIVHQDRQQIVEKRKKRQDLDDLMAGIMSEESLEADG